MWMNEWMNGRIFGAKTNIIKLKTVCYLYIIQVSVSICCVM